MDYGLIDIKARFNSDSNKNEVKIMRNEYNKCYFCKSYDEYEGCEWGCEDKKGFEPSHDRIIAKAKEKDISVADVIALINM